VLHALGTIQIDQLETSAPGTVEPKPPPTTNIAEQSIERSPSAAMLKPHRLNISKSLRCSPIVAISLAGAFGSLDRYLTTAPFFALPPQNPKIS
jgi:hypothetical protein